MQPKLGVVIPSYHSDRYIRDILASLSKSTFSLDCIEVIIVDNPHADHPTSLPTTQEALESHPELRAHILPQTTNTGFAGGCNVGIRKALELSCDYVFLHNQDGFVDQHTFQQLVDAMEHDPSIGAAQPLILLYPETDLVNSAGNTYHFLGFSYCGSFRLRRDQLTLPAIENVQSVSGAALMLRASALREYGALEDEWYLYHEDVAYSLKMHLVNMRTVLVRDAVFYHHYNFSHFGKKWFYLERNRWGTLLVFYKWQTLLLLSPWLLLAEFATLWNAYKQDWLQQKFDAYGYWLTPSHWHPWLEIRKKIQAMRKISDAELLRHSSHDIHLPHEAGDNTLLERFANPFLAASWGLISRLIQW